MLRIITIKSKHSTYIAQKPLRVLEFLFKILGGPSVSRGYRVADKWKGVLSAGGRGDFVSVAMLSM